MNLIIENLLPVGLLVGFEYYRPDEDYDFHELEISLLILRFTLTWH
jgi:hypothetical protein